MRRLIWGLAYIISTASLGVGEPTWTRMASSNFVMYTTAGERSARDTLRYFEQVRAFFTKSVQAKAEKEEPVRIVAFNSMKEFDPYRFNEVAIAYYHPSASHDYIVMSHTGWETFPVAIHEYVHLVVRHSHLDLPPWFNEGIAELYSTLKPDGDKILVGSLIPGRFQALLREKWVPLDIILSAGHDSPYYNEKNKAGNLYDEGWALTHMLALSNEYRGKFSQFLHSVGAGTPSAEALQQTYGKSVHQVERDLQGYLRGGHFQGVLVDSKLEKVGDDLKAEPADPFDVALVLSEIGDRPGREKETHAAFEELTATYPNRAEPYADLAHLAWRHRQVEEARTLFAQAFNLGDRDPAFLFDYGRLSEAAAPTRAIEALSLLLKQAPDRQDVRTELASAQLNARLPNDAVQTLAPVKKVSKEDAPRLLTLFAYAYLGAGNFEQARNAAEQLKQVSSNPVDVDRADQVLRHLDASRSEQTKPSVIFAESEAAPTLRRSTSEPLARAVVKLPSASGMFTELQCGQQTRIVLDTPEGKKIFLIDDPMKLLVNGATGSMDLQCGPQKRIEVRIDYNPADREGIDGIARAIRFNP